MKNGRIKWIDIVMKHANSNYSLTATLIKNQVNWSNHFSPQNSQLHVPCRNPWRCESLRGNDCASLQNTCCARNRVSIFPLRRLRKSNWYFCIVNILHAAYKRKKFSKSTRNQFVLMTTWMMSTQLLPRSFHSLRQWRVFCPHYELKKFSRHTSKIRGEYSQMYCEWKPLISSTTHHRC